MKRFLLFCLFLIALSKTSWAQTESDSIVNPNFYRNSVYLEVGGNAGFGSVNYERLIPLSNRKTILAFRLGTLFIPEGKPEGKFKYELLVPIEVSVLLGEGPWKTEVGAGITFYQNSDSKNGIFGSSTILNYEGSKFEVGRIGRRFEVPDFPFFGRIGIAVIYLGKYGYWFPVFPWAEASVGYSF